METGTPSSSATNTKWVVAGPQTASQTPQGLTATLGGLLNVRAPPGVPEGARSALGRPSSESTADMEASTAQVEVRGKWPLDRPHYTKGVS